MPKLVAPGIHLLEVSWPEPIGANAYLVDDRDVHSNASKATAEEVTLVDCGLPIPRRSLVGELRRAGYEPTGIDRVLLTHYDIDHVGGLARLDIDAPVFMGAADVALLRRSWSPPWCHHKAAFHRLVRRVYNLDGVDLRSVKDGDRVGGFRAIHTPGHNPGHTVYVHDTLDAAFLGDLVWESGGEFMTPPWIDSYDTTRIVESVRRVAGERFEHACVGHGTPVTPDGDEALHRLAAAQ